MRETITPDVDDARQAEPIAEEVEEDPVPSLGHASHLFGVPGHLRIGPGRYRGTVRSLRDINSIVAIAVEKTRRRRNSL
jgi:hypothetical protein